MHLMALDKNSGFLTIDDFPVHLLSTDEFVGSDFYKRFSPFRKIGEFIYVLEDVIWNEHCFSVEFRPAIFSFSPCVYLMSQDGAFYSSLTDWNKRADLNLLSEESKTLVSWVENILSLDGRDNIPSGTRWVLPWGSIAVQSNTRTFDCGIYISWEC